MLVSFVANELELEPWLFKTSSLLVQTPAIVCLFTTFKINSSTPKRFQLRITHAEEHKFFKKPMAVTKNQHIVENKLSIITWTKLSVIRNWNFCTNLNRHSHKKSNRQRLFSLLKYGTLLEQKHAYNIWNQIHLRTPHHQSADINF